LVAVNRLRRILGGAEPITEVANKPKPKVVVPVVPAVKVVNSFQGHASWYGPGFHGRLTANGERFNQNALTAAHKTLPFGTKVRVTNLNNGRSVVVRINDRGPFIRGRLIDLSKGSAQQIGLVASGVANVKLEILGN
jgi:rare lipoprotein A